MSSLLYNSAQPPLSILAIAQSYAASHPSFTINAQPNASLTLTVEDGNTFTNTNLILRYFARSLGSHLYGSNAIEATQIDFFLELSLLVNNKDTLQKYAELLQQHLSTRTYLVGQNVTIADYAVWDQLSTNPRWSAFRKQSAAQFPHIIRYIDTIEALPEVIQAKSAKTKLEDEKKAVLAQKAKGGSYDIELPGAEMGKVVTRFPPEPSGYLHIGHVKACLLNDSIAKLYNGKMILRFDDTNPSKEKDEYVENILHDIKTLGVDYCMITYTSDHFDTLAKFAEKMIQSGLAYVDNTPVDEMRKQRMDGIESATRNNSVEENMRVWKLMWAGEPEGLAYCLRAKIDMKANNKTLRDPVIYRCNIVTPHHRTGTKYKCYPTYDLACPIVDSIEGVTHCLRTDEYRDRNEQFYWFIDALKLRKPIIRDYSRLNFVYTLLSKRKLQWFVDTKRVDGWFDPRFPTVQGMLRRGMTVAALREFIHGQGFSISQNMMEWDKIWTINKRCIDPIAPRYTAVSAEHTVPLVIKGVNGTTAHTVELHNKNKSVGYKVITKSPTILLEQDDAKLIADGEEITLMAWGNVIINKVHREGDLVVKLEGTDNPQGDAKNTQKKLHWVDQSSDNVPVTLVEFDTLITVPKIEEGMDFDSIVNPVTRYETQAIGEAAIRNVQKGSIIQLQRRGFFIVDQISFPPNQQLTVFLIPDGRMKAMSTLSSKVDKAKTFNAEALKAKLEK